MIAYGILFWASVWLGLSVIFTGVYIFLAMRRVGGQHHFEMQADPLDGDRGAVLYMRHRIYFDPRTGVYDVYRLRPEETASDRGIHVGSFEDFEAAAEWVRTFHRVREHS